MSEKNVINLGEVSGMHRSPEHMLLEALEEVRNGRWDNRKKMLVLTVDEENNSYRVNWMQAGMHMSQCLTMCEVAKALFLKEMNYIPELLD